MKNPDQGNPFLFIGYYEAKDLHQLMLINDETEIDISFNQLNPQIRRLLSQTVQGKDVVSPVFYESGFKCDVIVYGVPVFESNGTVQGVVCGVKDLERFKEKIDGPSISNVKLDVAWITFEREWICSFQNNMLRQSGENIFENPNISKQEREHLKNAMEDQQVYQVQLNTQDGVHTAYFQPLGMNGWCLRYVDSIHLGHSLIYPILSTTNVIIGLMILLCIGFMFYVHRAMYNSNQDLVHLAYFDKITGAYNFEKFQHFWQCTLPKVRITALQP